MASTQQLVYRLKEAGTDGVRAALESIPTPSRGEYLVKIHAISLNYRDYKIANQSFFVPVKFERIPMSDGAGEIVAVGEGANKFKVGDRVVATFCNWITGTFSQEVFATALGGPVDGVGRQYATLEEERLVKIPDSLSFEEAATLPTAGIVAWNALHEGPTPIRPGQSVVILGTGGVAIFALQFAVLAGARVIITSSSDEKLAKARELGAFATINYKTHPDWEQEVLRLTNGKGASHVIELGGVDTLAKTMTAIAQNGTITVVGGVSGFNGGIPAVEIIKKTPIIRGVLLGSREMFERMIDAMTQHKTHPVIHKRFKFEQLVEGLKYLHEGAHFGKVVLTVA